MLSNDAAPGADVTHLALQLGDLALRTVLNLVRYRTVDRNVGRVLVHVLESPDNLCFVILINDEETLGCLPTVVSEHAPERHNG